MAKTEKGKMEALHFNERGVAVTRTASGKKIWIRQNDRNTNKPYFTVDLEDKHLFSRGSLGKVFEAIKNN